MADVLLIVGDATALTAGDTDIQNRLANTLGHTVTTQSDEDAVGTHDAVVAAPSIVAANTDSGTLESYTAPVMAMHGDLWQLLHMTQIVGQDNSGNPTAQWVDHTDPASDLHGGKSSPVTVTSTASTFWYCWQAQFTSDAIRVWTVNDNFRVAVAEYKTGDALHDTFTAASERVAWGIWDSAVPNLTSDGWDLFDAAVRFMVPDGGGGGEHHSTTTDPLDIPLTYGQADAAKTASVSGAALALGVTYGQAPAAKHGSTAGDPQALGVSLGQAPAAKHATASGDPITLGVTYAVAPVVKHAVTDAAPLSLALTLAPAVTDATEQHATAGDPLDLAATLGQATGVKHAAVTATPLNLGLVLGQGQTTPQLDLAALDLAATVTPRQHRATVQPRQYAAAVDTETYDATVTPEQYTATVEA